MHPVLTTLRIGSETRPLGSYGACLALAVLLGAGLLVRRASREGHQSGDVIAVAGVTVLSGFFGAYVLALLVNFQLTGSWSRAFATPGLVFYGGALFGALGFVAACRAFGVAAARLADACVPALPLAHALGRVGCFLGGCCYGAEHHGVLAVTYLHPLAPAAHPAVARHPWPMYEAAALVVLACVFAWPRLGSWLGARFGSSGAAGTRFALYALAYACLRFALEPLRGDAIRGLHQAPVLAGVAVSTSQLVSFLVVLLAGLYWLASRRLGSRPLRV